MKVRREEIINQSFSRCVYSLEPLTSYQIGLLDEQKLHVTVLPRELSEIQKAEQNEHIEFLIARDRDDIEQVLDICTNLKFLFIVSTGVEKLPFKKLYDRQVVVVNTGGVNSEIMSQYVMAYILADSARVCENLNNQMRHYWKPNQCVDCLRDKSILLVGAGRVGRLVALKAKSFGMKCFGVKKHLEEIDGFEKIETLDHINDLLPLSDYVVCCLPLTPETNNFFSEEKFNYMKQSSMFINISRGKCVNERDLINALLTCNIRQAVLDVYNEEPIHADSPLWDIPNLWLSPHSSGRLENFMDEAITLFCNNYMAYNNNEELPNQVNLVNGY